MVKSETLRRWKARYSGIDAILVTGLVTRQSYAVAQPSQFRCFRKAYDWPRNVGFFRGSATRLTQYVRSSFYKLSIPLSDTDGSDVAAKGDIT